MSDSPLTNKEIRDLIQEWTELKQRAFWLLIGSAAILVGYGVWVGSIQTNLTQHKEALQELGVELRALETRTGSLEVTNGEIKTRLTSIDLTLQEIKAAVRQIK